MWKSKSSKIAKIIRSFGIYEIFAILGILLVAAYCIYRNSFFLRGSVLGASIIAYLLAFLLTSCGLKRQGLGAARLFYAVAGAAAARWLFEIFYHFGFPVSLSEVIRNLGYLSTNISVSNFPLIWSVMMVIIIFTGYKYMSVGKLFWIIFGIAVVSFTFWKFIGYPQWVHPERWPVTQPVINLIPSEYAHSTSESATSLISNISLVVNSITKIAICALLPSLFMKKTNMPALG